ncbi:MAG: hypothetical protein JNJ45_12290 [Chthonomonas sp.]|nr:hypothetical protein [Chthonomonas sp.]
MQPTPREQQTRDAVIAEVLRCIDEAVTIKLPAFNPDRQTGSDFALQHVGIEANPFGGTVGAFRYQFEAEEDLLHLFILRLDGEPISVTEGRPVAAFVLGEVPPAMIWFKPGEYSQHYYLGHEALTWVRV